MFRILAGGSLPSRQRLAAMLAVMGATDEERERAFQLHRIADAHTAVIQHADDLADKYLRFRMDEAEAVKERSIDTVVVPGLLQTPEYVTAIAHGRRRLLGRGSKSVGEERRDRKALLHREPNPLVLHALVHEAALRTVVGSTETMVAQLDHVLTMVKLPNVTVQVVPFEFGAHGSMTGPWFLLGFPEPDEPDSAYAESVAGIDTVEEPTDVAGLSDIWRAIAKAAPSPARSVEIIRRIRDEMKG